MDKNSTDLRDDLIEAIAVAQETWAQQAGSKLASTVHVGEDITWCVHYDGSLRGQVSGRYKASTVRVVVQSFADMLGAPVTEWAAENLAGIETSAPFAGLTVTVWGTVA